ncbi:MAG: M16 family metallopeptidase [Thermodesulfobacteriota bacterium]
MRYRRSFWVLSIAFFLLVLGIFASFAQGRFRQFTLDNGLKVILEENRNAPVVALQIWVNVGSADERDEEAGMCHFIEHMIFKGTEKRKVREMAREIESMGGSINAYTSYDQTVFHVTLASRYADTGLDILADAIQHSTFDPVELEREREVILEEIRMGQDDPSRKLFQQTMAALFETHPYRRPIIGYEKTIRSIQRDQMVSFFKRWYASNRVTFVAVGDFELQNMEGKVREVFKDFKPSSESVPSRIREPVKKEFQSAISQGNFKETYLQMAVPIPSVKHEDTPALDALAHILGGGEAARLIQKVKLEKGLVNSISASSFTPKDPGAFMISATLPVENLEKATEAILREIHTVRREGAATEELSRVKVNVESELIYDRQTVQGQARKLGYYEVVTGDLQFEKDYLRRVSLLQREDIKKVVEKYFRGPWIVSVLVPSEKAERVKSIDFPSIFEKATSPEPDGEAKGKAGVFRTVLDNGIRLIVKENRSNPIVTLQASFLGGVRFEEASQNGINHLISVMLTKGTERQSNLEIAKKVERMAGSFNGFSGYNSFGLTFTFLSQHFEDAFSLFGEVLRQPSFDAEELERRKRLTLAAIQRQEDDLDRMAFKLFREALYEKHPYRMDTLGTPESVRGLTRELLKEYYSKMAVPENMVLAVVGDVETKQVVDAAQKALGDLKRVGFSPPRIPLESPPVRLRRSENHQKKEQAHFVLGFLGTSFRDKDHYALEVLDGALSGQGGRLFYQLRDKESLAYALAFVAWSNLDPGFVGVYMGTHPDKLDRAIESVLRELKRVKEEGLTEDEVERAKRFLIGNFEIGLQTNRAQANRLSLDELYGLGYDYYQRYPQEIQKVSKEDVQRVVQKYFNFEAYVLAILRPPAEKKE